MSIEAIFCLFFAGAIIIASFTSWRAWQCGRIYERRHGDSPVWGKVDPPDWGPIPAPDAPQVEAKVPASILGWNVPLGDAIYIDGDELKVNPGCGLSLGTPECNADGDGWVYPIDPVDLAGPGLVPSPLPPSSDTAGVPA